jgi:RNA recognition motif-containing protein
VFIPRDRTAEGGHRGFGFVEFENADDAKAAIDNMHMNRIFGETIRCNLARPTRITTAGIHAAPVWELEAAAGVVNQTELGEDEAAIANAGNVNAEL